jgi:hypothetical protein
MTPEDRAQFHGRAAKRWEDLAKQLENTLVAGLGIPKQFLAPFSPSPELNKLDPGEEGTKRTVVAWRNWPRNANRFVSIDETTRAFAAEFDVETGELKWINLNSPAFIAALRMAQSVAK